jgi:hypothetical protein
LSFDYYWIGRFIDASEHARIAPHFAAAAAKSELSLEAQQAIADWRAHPSDYEEDAWHEATPQEQVERVRAFLRAFNLLGFVELSVELITMNGAFSDMELNEQNARMTITASHPTVSILWHALGFERAKALPGQMGNLLLHPKDVEAALEATRRAFAGMSRESLLAAARRFCSSSVFDGPLREVLNFLPDGLETALARKAGFLALARPQI